MTSNFGDATTVGDAPLAKHSGEYPSDNSNTLAKGTNARAALSQRPRNDFTTSDYGLQERPFFVPIGNGGVVTALQKLDHQLLNVSPNHHSHALNCALPNYLGGKTRAFL